YVIDDAVHRAMVADPHFDAGLHQFARDVGLDVGEPDRHVGLQREDLVDVRAGEGRNLRLLLARALRTHGESGNADDAVLFAEGVQDLGWFFREANDPSRPTHHGYRRRSRHAPSTHSQRWRSFKRCSCAYQHSTMSGTTR